MWVVLCFKEIVETHINKPLGTRIFLEFIYVCFNYSSETKNKIVVNKNILI